jgi:hypothetical protein
VLAACRSGHLRVVKMLYAAGAAMDATNFQTKENTASLAVKSGNTALLQFLLDRGVANVSRKAVMTPLGGFPTKKSQNVVSPRALKATTVQLGQVIKKGDKLTRHKLLQNAEQRFMALDINDLQKLWSSCDVNGNGLVSQSELENFVMKQFPELDWKVNTPLRHLPRSHIALTPAADSCPAALRSSSPTNQRTASFLRRNSARCCSIFCGRTSSKPRFSAPACMLTFACRAGHSKP